MVHQPILIPEEDMNEQYFKSAQQETLKNHKRDREILLRVIQNGAKQDEDPLLKNSCQWLLSKKLKVFAVTELVEAFAYFSQGNSKEVLEGELENTTLYFPNCEQGKGDIFSDMYEYTTKEDIDMDYKTTKAWQKGDYVAFVVAINSEKDIHRFIIHEVSHAADLSSEGLLGFGKRTNENILEFAKLKMMTEYRAYSKMGLPEVEKASPVKMVKDPQFSQEVSERFHTNRVPWLLKTSNPMFCMKADHWSQMKYILD